MEEKHKKYDRILMIMAICSVVFVIGSCLTVFLYWKGGSYEQRGTFGDMFGSINAVFSGLAFAGIILTIFMQKKELEYQREELRDTRLEFKINRLTNIIFKQLEYLNSQLDRTYFDWSPGSLTENKTIGLMEFVDNLEELERQGHDWQQRMKNHEKTINKAIIKVRFAFESFEAIASQSNVDIEEIKKLKKFMQSNVDPAFYTLVSLKIKSLKKPNSEDEKLKEREKAILKLELELLTYILNYDK